jgi:hypothetical protein
MAVVGFEICKRQIARILQLQTHECAQNQCTANEAILIRLLSDYYTSLFYLGSFEHQKLVLSCEQLTHASTVRLERIVDL